MAVMTESMNEISEAEDILRRARERALAMEESTRLIKAQAEEIREENASLKSRIAELVAQIESLEQEVRGRQSVESLAEMVKDAHREFLAEIKADPRREIFEARAALDRDLAEIKALAGDGRNEDRSPLTRCARVAVLMTIGREQDKARYLRDRGWVLSSGGWREFDAPLADAWPIAMAFQRQSAADCVRMEHLIKEQRSEPQFEARANPVPSRPAVIVQQVPAAVPAPTVVQKPAVVKPELPKSFRDSVKVQLVKSASDLADVKNHEIDE